MKNIILIVFIILTLCLRGFIVYDKFVSNQLNNVDSANENDQTAKKDLTSDESTYLLNYINNKELKGAFSIYYKDTSDTFVFAMNDDALNTFEMTDSYKINNHYYLTLTNKNISRKVVMTKENNQYYFYSCN